MRQETAEVEERMSDLEGRVVRLFAAVGEHRMKWGIVAWVLGTAAAAAIAMLARQAAPFAAELRRA